MRSGARRVASSRSARCSCSTAPRSSTGRAAGSRGRSGRTSYTAIRTTSRGVVRTGCPRSTRETLRRLGRRRDVQRAALARAVPHERRRSRDRGRRPRLDGRHRRLRTRQVPGGTSYRAGEPRPRRRLEPWHRRDVGRLRADPERRRVGGRRRDRPARRVRRRASACGDRRTAAAPSGRTPAAVGARLSDSLAAGHRVPVLAEARAAIDEVGLLDERFFLFSEETDWCYRFRRAGWQVLFTPDAEFAHVYGAAHQGRMFRENVRGNLRFIAKHQGARAAARARWVLLVGCLLRAPRDRQYLRIARWLARRPVPELLAG